MKTFILSLLTKIFGSEVPTYEMAQFKAEFFREAMDLGADVETCHKLWREYNGVSMRKRLVYRFQNRLKKYGVWMSRVPLNCILIAIMLTSCGRMYSTYEPVTATIDSLTFNGARLGYGPTIGPHITPGGSLRMGPGVGLHRRHPHYIVFIHYNNMRKKFYSRSLFDKCKNRTTLPVYLIKEYYATSSDTTLQDTYLSLER